MRSKVSSHCLRIPINKRNRIKTKFRYSNLSLREIQVSEYVLLGLSNKEIAQHLGICEDTVKEYLGNVFRKIGVTNRTALVSKILMTI